MKLMLRNLFHILLRIVERKSTNGEVEYWCQYQNIFGKWKNGIKYDMFGMARYAVFIHSKMRMNLIMVRTKKKR